MTEPEPYEDAVPPPYLAEATPEELAAYGTDENPWPPPPDDWALPTAPAGG